MLIKEALNLLDRHFEENILELFHHVVTSSYFSLAGQFCKQTNGMAMGLLVTATFFMEDFQEMAFNQRTHKSSAGSVTWMILSSTCPKIRIG